MRSDITAVKRLLQKGERKAPFTKTWQRIYDEEGIGTRQGKDIHFSGSEMDHLKRMISQSTGLDVLEANLSGDRIEMAAQTANEKLANGQVFGALLLVARAGMRPIVTFEGDAVTPPGTLLSIEKDALDLSEVNKVLLIENGAVMRKWHRLSLPEDCADALIIYRGHGENCRDVQSALVDRPDTCALFGFYDFDPAGSAMAAATEVDYVVLPEDWESLTAESEFVLRFNKRDVFLDQSPQITALKNTNQPLYLALAEHYFTQKLAITQEHLLVNGVPLVAQSPDTC